MADFRTPRSVDKTNHGQILIAGGVIGALLGIGAAHLLWQARERRVLRTGEAGPLLTGGDAMQLGMLAAGFFRKIGDLALRDR
jgi:hypothetical protein